MGTLFGMAALTTTGCKKETAQQPSASNAPGASVKNMARTYNDSETEKIVADAQTFQQYANDLREGKTPNAGALAASYLPEDAVFLLESTTNYWYGRPNHFRPKDTTRNFENAAALTDGKISLGSLAASYNVFRSQFKGFYEGISGEKSFGFVDYEYNTDGQKLKAVPSVQTGAENALVLTWKNIHVDQVFTGNTFYEGGEFGISASCPGAPRSTTWLSYYVRQNLGFYDNIAQSIYDPIPVAINITPSAINYNNPSAQTSTPNPWASTNPNLINYTVLFAMGVPNNLNNNMCIPTNAMNYYRAGQKQMIINLQNALNKKCIKYVLGGAIPMTNGPAIYEHYLGDNWGNSKFQFADIIYTPSPNLATF